MAEILEIFMIVSFGASWPLNVVKSYKARTAKGKSLGFLLFIFGKELIDTIGFGPFKNSFYWRHAIPLGIIIIVSLWMFIIAFRAYIKRNKRYKKILKQVYEIFKLENPDNISHDDWEEFVEKYDPRAFKELEE